MKFGYRDASVVRKSRKSHCAIIVMKGNLALSPAKSAISRYRPSRSMPSFVIWRCGRAKNRSLRPNWPSTSTVAG
jgi:hypothetical protein